MWLCAGLSIAAAAAAILWLKASGAPMRWELLLAVSGGVAGTLLLTGALMGLLFVSNQSGHDASVGHGDGGDGGDGGRGDAGDTDDAAAG
jgi:hypothetical protein